MKCDMGTPSGQTRRAENGTREAAAGGSSRNDDFYININMKDDDFESFLFSRPFNSFYNQMISIQISIYSKLITLCSRFCKIRGQSSVLSLHDSVLV